LTKGHMSAVTHKGVGGERGGRKKGGDHPQSEGEKGKGKKGYKN